LAFLDLPLCSPPFASSSRDGVVDDHPPSGFGGVHVHRHVWSDGLSRRPGL